MDARPRACPSCGDKPGHDDGIDEIERLHQPIADGVAHQRGGGLEVELAHRGGAMSLDSLDAQVENLAHLLVAVTLGDQLHDHALARRQHRFVLAVVGGKE